MLYPFQVGQPLIPGRDNLPEGIGYSYDRGGHLLLVRYNDLTQEQIQQHKDGKTAFALLVHGSALFILSRLAFDGGWSDTPYNWWEAPAPERQRPDLSSGAAAVVVVLVEARTGIVKSLKLMSWTRKFTKALHEALAKQARSAYDPRQYQKDIQSAYRKWESPDAMAADAIARCIGGEDIDTDEPLTPRDPVDGRANDVARLAGVDPDEVRALSVDDARIRIWPLVGEEVFECLFIEPALFWDAGGKIWFDDPQFGDVVAVTDLGYDQQLGMHVHAEE